MNTQVQNAAPAPYPSEFDAFGHVVPDGRRDRAYRWLRSIGVDRAAAFSCVEMMSQHILKDRPHEAIARARETVDLTGSYRLLAYLVTGDPNGDE
jgi:hypothetical protein